MIGTAAVTLLLLGLLPGIGQGRAPSAAPISPNLREWLALGDSYSSGEGVTEAVNGSADECERSPLAYSPAAANSMKAVPSFDPAVLLACTGAIVLPAGTVPAAAVINAQKDTVDKTAQFQLAEPAAQVHGDGFDVITMSFGGNDLGFAAALIECVRGAAESYAVLTGVGWTQSPIRAGLGLPATLPRHCFIDAAEKQTEIAALKPSLLSLYEQAAQRLRPGGHLYVLGYPRLFAPSSSWSSFNTEYGCSAFTTGDANTISGLVGNLNAAISEIVIAANAAVNHDHPTAGFARNIAYLPIDGVYAAGDDHDLCGKAAQWINGITLDSNEPQRLFSSSFHPNAAGHTAVAAMLAKKVADDIVGAPSVDWKNRQYTTNCSGVSKTLVHIDVLAGSGKAPSADPATGYDLGLEQASTGQLFQQGNGATAVLLRCDPSPSNYYTTEIEVFTADQKLVAEFQPPDLVTAPGTYPLGLFGAPTVTAGHVSATVDYALPGTPHAEAFVAGSVRYQLTWTWQSDHFALQIGSPVQVPAS